MPPNFTKLYPLDSEQVQAITGLVNLRLNELTMIRENPSIIDLYASILTQLRER